MTVKDTSELIAAEEAAPGYRFQALEEMSIVLQCGGLFVASELLAQPDSWDDVVSRRGVVRRALAVVLGGELAKQSYECITIVPIVLSLARLIPTF